MKISLNWINDYVDTSGIDADWLINKLTVTTAEVEGVEKRDDDIIIEIDNKSLTHRPDLWCHYGFAREISAITSRSLKPLNYLTEEDLKCDKPELEVQLEAKDKCLRYSAVKINNTKAEPSPEFIAVRLASCGIRPINVIVDIANYVMLDMGQPLHTFDKEGIDVIKISSSEKETKFLALDKVERNIPVQTLMICSQDSPLALAGIIGGEASAVSDKTTGIILESAVFEGTAIRKTSQAIGLRTDASARYEKFLDTELTTTAIGRFIKLLKTCQSQIELGSQIYDNIVSEVKLKNIKIQHSYIETYLGNSISKDAIENILRSLQFGVQETEGVYNITVPTFRATRDISCKADIIEEVLRVYGYDNIKPCTYKMEVVPAHKNTMRDLNYCLKDLLVKKFNLNEVQSYSWYDNKWLRKLDNNHEEALKIQNSTVKQYEKLRTDIAPNLLKIIHDNRKNYEEIRIFEVGIVYLLKDGELVQPRHLTAAIYSRREEEEVYRELKGICKYLLKSSRNIEAEYVEIRNSSSSNNLGVYYNSDLIGSIYSIPSDILKLYGSGTVINILDIDLERLNITPKREIKYKQILKYPETYLDFSLLSVEGRSYSELENIVKEFAHPLLLETKYIDTYVGKNIQENMKSTTFRLIIGNIDRTLQLCEINDVKGLFIRHLENYEIKLR